MVRLMSCQKVFAIKKPSCVGRAFCLYVDEKLWQINNIFNCVILFDPQVIKDAF
jgi:hypothetical protein